MLIEFVNKYIVMIPCMQLCCIYLMIKTYRHIRVLI